jgi:integrase
MTTESPLPKYISSGVHPKVVQERPGHSQVSVTLDTYSHVAPSLQREAAVRVDELIAGAPHSAS